MKITPLLLVVCSIALAAQQAATPPVDNGPHSPEINTTLMESTFLIFGPSSRPAEQTPRAGTAFVMVRPLSVDSPLGRPVLITAKHVFEDIAGDFATVKIRKYDSSGDVVPSLFQLKIRDNGKPLYTAHDTADVAAIDINLPNDSVMVKLNTATNVNWLATDDFLQSIKIHPGDELLCLGYPFGYPANDAGYPVLRSGKIASYPVVPLKKAGKLLFDFRVLPGNSGGPVYFAYTDRGYNGKLTLGMMFQKIFGIVVQQVNPLQNTDPSIGIIVPSVYIKETIDKLAGFESNIKEDL